MFNNFYLLKLKFVYKYLFTFNLLNILWNYVCLCSEIVIQWLFINNEFYFRLAVFYVNKSKIAINCLKISSYY